MLSRVSGVTETADSDPKGEDFCGFGTHLVCRPFVWENGAMNSLPTLGGNNGEAGLINHHGEIAGNVENKTRDRTCPAGGPQVFEEKPVIWKMGEVRELLTAPGDPDGWAFGINDRGQVVGASGSCSQLTRRPAFTSCLATPCFGIGRDRSISATLAAPGHLDQAMSGWRSTTRGKWLVRQIWRETQPTTPSHGARTLASMTWARCRAISQVSDSV